MLLKILTKRNVRPQDGDLVLVKGDKLGDMVCYGVVNKDLSPQIVLIKLKGGGEIERAVGQTILPTHTEKSFLTNI